MDLRKHQAEFCKAIHDIKSGRKMKNIYCSIFPGGGKSMYPFLLGDLIPEYADRICWVVSNKALYYQSERELQPLNFHWNVKRNIKGNIKAVGLKSESCAFVTTYEEIFENFNIYKQEFVKRKCILFLDDSDSISKGSARHKLICNLSVFSFLSVFVSGSFSLLSERQSAFFPLKKRGSFSGKHRTSCMITYSLSDAFKDGAVVPLHFNYIKNEIKWVKKESAGLLYYSEDADQVFTPLYRQYALRLLFECFRDWVNYKTNEYSGAKLLIAAADVESARQYQEYINSVSSYHVLVAEDQGVFAVQSSIECFEGIKNPGVDILITSGDLFCGLSVKEITHTVCLTHINSVPLLEQCFTRGNRVSPGKTESFVYGPADKILLETARSIEQMQLHAFGSADYEFEQYNDHKHIINE